MANELYANLPVGAWTAEKGMGYSPADALTLAVGGKVRGLSLPKKATGSSAFTGAGYTATFIVPPAPAMATGMTFKFGLTDDGVDSADLGKVVRIGITLKRLINDETIDVDASAATEATVDVTLSSTTLGYAVGSIALTAGANVDSTAVGEACLIRLRRIGTATQDTCNGRVLFYGVLVYNT